MTVGLLLEHLGRNRESPSWARKHSANQATETSDEEDINYGEEEEEYDDYDWNYEWEEENEIDDDPDHVAYVDEEGWFYADEDTINAIDEQLAEEEDEFAAILTNYTEARGALAKARIARGFYPVVVPADIGPQPRFGRVGKPSGGKGKSKGRGKGKRPKGAPRPKARARPNAKGQPPPPPRPSWGRPDRPAGKPRAAPICFRCGKNWPLECQLHQCPERQKIKADGLSRCHL